MSISDSWTTNIFASTSCLRRQDATAVETCLQYLCHLEAQLRLPLNDECQWDVPPVQVAPDWTDFATNFETQNNDDEFGNGEFGNGNGNHHRNQGRTHTPDFRVRAPNTGYNLDCRRILIRILTSQSECRALKASSFRRSREWKGGANQIQMALEKIHEALGVADTQISKWIMMEGMAEDDVSTGEEFIGDEPVKLQKLIRASKEDLMEDANIVVVAIGSLTTGRENFITAGRKEEAALLRQLEPQWEARDEIKRRIGEDRWRNNTRPKNNYARMRKELEIRYREVRDAIHVLERMDSILDQATKRTLELKHQLDSDVDVDAEVRRLSKRYNGFRPDTSMLGKRVSLIDYPDPTEFNWTFTGSSGVTEFFEKDDVKLDWYFTTATMKTSLEHPTQGKTQMFRKNVDPSLYREILENPRAHTNKGYQRKNRNE